MYIVLISNNFTFTEKILPFLGICVISLVNICPININEPEPKPEAKAPRIIRM